ncbi:MAG: hypothetical protein NVV73_02850 [Cellvibrionaceae bacterium]|nr:hypothetical protein [Cellvibrionaceae bacterium]
MAKQYGSTQADFLRDAFNQYTYWLRWWEMMVASGLTIGLRLSGISYKLRRNQMPDLTEMWRMGDEKNTAAWQSLAALPKASAGFDPFKQVDFFRQVDLFKHMDLFKQQAQMQAVLFDLWRPFYSASTANAFRLSGTRRPRAKK